MSVVVETASSAKPGLDFVRPTSTLVDFGTNQATATLEIALLADQLAEGEETIRLSLSSVLGEHGIGRERTGEVVILDAGTPPAYSQLEFPEGPLSVPESADAARVRVRFTGSPVVLPYRTVDGTAVGGVDFESMSGLVTNAPGTGDWVLPIPLIARTEPGPDRVFTLIVGTRTNTIRILDGHRIGALLAIPGKELNADGN